jgi:glyceraldehyde-3-phosphate dehydrogenase/erythrose-4-phosphate dehydrogenase
VIVASCASWPQNCGINGFGRIGRLVARIMVKDPETKLLHVNAGSASPDYMAYQFKYDSIHGRFDGAVLVDGDDLYVRTQSARITAPCAHEHNSAQSPTPPRARESAETRYSS